MSPDDRSHVVVIGAGFGGLELVRNLRHSGARITLIDQRNHHLFQPLLYQVATTILATSEIAWPIRQIFRDRADVQTLLARVDGVDTAARTVRLDNGETIAYDTLVIATGSRHAYFGHNEWEAVAPGLKTLEDATTIRRKILLAFELAERERDPAKRQALLTFAIIGAGPTGVELAGIIAELAKRTLRDEFRSIDTLQSRIILIEAGDRVLAAFPPDLSAYAARELQRRGVDIWFGRPVTECTPDGLRVGEEFLPCRTAVWAAGVAASPAAKWLGAKSDRAGRVFVAPDLTLPDHPEIFVIGDTAAVQFADGSTAPGIAPAAKQQGHYVSQVIKARLSNKPAPGPFQYRHQGNLATIGNGAAVVHIGKLRLTGRLAWWFWGIAHIFFLIGVRSRTTVAWSWLWTSLTGQNSSRLITQGDSDPH